MILHMVSATVTICAGLIAPCSQPMSIVQGSVSANMCQVSPIILNLNTEGILSIKISCTKRPS